MGCVQPGCHIITGIESQVTNLRMPCTYTNPVASGGNVTVATPCEGLRQQPLRLSLISADGRLVQEEMVSMERKDGRIPVSPLPRSPLHSGI